MIFKKRKLCSQTSQYILEIVTHFIDEEAEGGDLYPSQILSRKLQSHNLTLTLFCSKPHKFSPSSGPLPVRSFSAPALLCILLCPPRLRMLFLTYDGSFSTSPCFSLSSECYESVQIPLLCELSMLFNFSKYSLLTWR